MSQQLIDRIRTFLLKKPRPDIVRVTTTGGETKEVHIEEDRVRWADVARTVANLSPGIIQAENSAEEVLRIEKISEAYAAPVDVAPAIHPVLPPHTDPETARLHHFSTLLAHAWEFSTGLAFNKLADQQEREARRMEAIEQRLERTEAAYRAEFHARVRDQLNGMDDGSQKEGMIDAFFDSFRRGRQNQTSEDAPEETASRYSREWGGDS